MQLHRRAALFDYGRQLVLLHLHWAIFQSKQLSSTSYTLGAGVDGLVVMTWAFQADLNSAKQAYNPGSNPGRRTPFVSILSK